MSTEKVGKQIILEFIDYVRYKVENDALTLEEAESIAKTLGYGLNLMGACRCGLSARMQDVINNLPVSIILFFAIEVYVGVRYRPCLVSHSPGHHLPRYVKLDAGGCPGVTRPV